jgi:hypothetical protein
MNLSQAQRNWHPAAYSSHKDGSKRRAKGRRPDQIVFHAGEIVKESGIYKVIHHQEHRLPHEVIMQRDDFFPSCDQCHEEVRFAVVHIAPYIFHDDDFKEQDQ